MGGSGSKAKAGHAPPKQKPPPKKEITAHERAVLDLKNQRDKLHRYRKQLESNIDRETQCAKTALAAGNKQRALLFLKKKKYQAGLLEKAENQQETIEEMVNAIEFAAMERDVFERLKEGKDMLEEINREMSVDEVDRLMEDTREAIEYQNQISEALAGKLSSEDEEDVLRELEAIEAAELDAELQTAPQVPTEPLPRVEQVASPVAASKAPREAELVAA